MGKKNYEKLITHFDSDDASLLRGKTTELGITMSALHVLDRIEPKKGSALLDIGCGDGLMISAIRKFRPDLHIDGVDISPHQCIKAQNNNPDSKIICGNILDIDLKSFKKKYNYIFSFSFLQYINQKDIFYLQSCLQQLTAHDGYIIHCSIPDQKFKLLNTVDIQLQKRGYWGLSHRIIKILPIHFLW